ncbi:MAG: RNA polymerase sigma factor [Planctomycetota bacterium]
MSRRPDPSEGDSDRCVGLGLEWLAQYGDMLYRFASRRVHEPSIAEDLVQDTFLCAIKSARGNGSPDCVEAWLVSILRRRIVDHYRRSSRDPTENRDQLIDEGNLAGGGVQGSDPAQSMCDDELREVIEECISKLPNPMRQAFELCVIKQLETAESTTLLGVSAAALASRLYRARLAIRDCVTQRWR